MVHILLSLLSRIPTNHIFKLCVLKNKTFFFVGNITILNTEHWAQEKVTGFSLFLLTGNYFRQCNKETVFNHTGVNSIFQSLDVIFSYYSY